MELYQNPSSTRADRKTIEKNRRNQMKTLYTKLSSLVPREPSREMVSLPDQLQGAMNYIKTLQEKLEEMKKKKNQLMGGSGLSYRDANGSRVDGGMKLPNIDIHVMGSALEVVLITGLNRKFMFGEIIRMLHEEGAEVVSASFSVLNDSVFHSIHLKIGGNAPEYEAARLSDKLRKVVYDQGLVN